MMYFESGMVDQARYEYETIILMYPGTTEPGFVMQMLSLIGQQAPRRQKAGNLRSWHGFDGVPGHSAP